MDYQGFFAEQLTKLKRENHYRVFADLERQTGRFPRALIHKPAKTHEITI